MNSFAFKHSTSPAIYRSIAAILLLFLGLAACQALSSSDSSSDEDASSLEALEALGLETLGTISISDWLAGEASGISIDAQCPVDIAGISGMEQLGGDSENGIWGFKTELSIQQAMEQVDKAMLLSGWICPEAGSEEGVAMYLNVSDAESDLDTYTLAMASAIETGSACTVVIAFA